MIIRVPPPVTVDNCTASITNDLNATITTDSLTSIGDKATATFTIKNESPNLKAKVENVSATMGGTNPTYFSITVSEVNTTLAKDATTTVTVTVELVKLPVENVSATIAVVLKATAVEN